MGAGMMGMENAQVAQARKHQAMMGSNVGDLTTPEGLKAKAEEFRQAGDIQTAFKLNQLAQQKSAEKQKMGLELRAQDFKETEAFDLKKKQHQDAIDVAREKMKSTAAAKRESIQARRDMASLAAAMRGGTAQPKPMTALQETKYRTQIAGDHGKMNDTIQKMQTILDSAENVRAAPGLDAATGVAAYVKSFPGGFGMEASDAAQADVRITNLTGKVTDLGKTIASASGAIGSMAIAEWRIVRDMAAAIDATKGKKPLLDQITEVEMAAQGVVDRMKDNYQKHYSADFAKYPQFSEFRPPVSSVVRSSGGKIGAPAASATQYVRTGTRSDGVRVGLKADGTQEVIK